MGNHLIRHTEFDFPFKARLCEAVFTPGGNLGDFSRWMDGNDGFYGTGAAYDEYVGRAGAFSRMERSLSTARTDRPCSRSTERSTTTVNCATG